MAYKEAITLRWNAKFQLVPPDMHCQNQAERAICTFKDHFLAILAGINSTLPPYLWDLLLQQAELTLNLLRQATLNPRISMWEFFQGPFDFNKTPLGPVGCRVLINAKMAIRWSWNFRAKLGFYIGPALDSYHFFKLVKADTKSQVIFDTVEFLHSYLSVPVTSMEDKIIHSLQVVAGAIQGSPPSISVSQLKTITVLQEIVESWCSFAPPSLWLNHRPAPTSPRVNLCDSPRVVSPSPTSTSPMLAPSTALSPPPQAAATSLTLLLSAPTFHATPCSLVFGNAHSPRVVSNPQQPLPPPAAPVLPLHEPISYCTRSHVPAPLALFTSGRQYHECVQYRIPTANSSCSPAVAMGLRASAPCITGRQWKQPTLLLFALLFCTRTTRWPCQSLTQQPEICWSIANSNAILGTKPLGILCMPMSLAISAKASAPGRSPAPSV